MIAIPDVESLIVAELSCSPSPTSRKVGVPPRKSRAASFVIPKNDCDRHVEIFDCQPLPSPTSSSGRSSRPSKRSGLRMSQITSPVSVEKVTSEGEGGRDGSSRNR